MGIKIHQLPAAIANQIAAGEVIERPASVVKELLENSLDAGATSITVEIGYGGLNQIKISDNGSGIDADDLPLSVAAHATSKITKLDDLYSIDSMGFRGEALASIASIAKVTISSKPAQQNVAMMLKAQGAELTISPCARTDGTTIDVVDLFYNAPVRKRFLKSEQLEFQAIEMIIKRFALSAPEIALTLKHNNKQVLQLPAANSEQAKLIRLTKIFGSAFMNDALYLNVELSGMSLRGWLSGPEYQRSQNDRQWIYINQRMVKDKLINHALKMAYDGFLHPGRFPACLLYFSIKTDEVDVNVHPTKHEVRFQQPRLIHDFFTSQLGKALRTASSQKNLTYSDKGGEAVSPPGIDVREPFAYEQYSDALRSRFNIPTGNRTAGRPFIPEVHESNCSTLTSLSPVQEVPWIILNNQFVLVFLKQQPHIVDVVALQQQWILVQLNQLTFPLASRPLLVPVSYTLPHKLMFTMDTLKCELEQLGLQIETVKDDRVLIRSVPIKLPYLDLPTFFNFLAELEHVSFEVLVDTFRRSQAFDPNYLSIDERIAMNEFLLNSLSLEGNFSGVCKALTVDDCRKLMHV
ncbi:DNA mismatch repair endonuclease MutL [uncultured Legionella sp.]|uniref:DNA mismatch repair endonuclease MutL n=1 Tax=uncultured Legionella sp. TaxID=210934 RepID=UPI002605052A|nr:DNA mismatch repair endonuclease MutL [uncultured Legionella sp.]